MATKDITTQQVLTAYTVYREQGYRWPTDYLMAVTGQPEKVCCRAMERECKRGLITYGVSLRGGMLTERGVEALAGEVAHDSVNG